MADAYWTMDPAYVESVWWSLKRLHERGLLVEADKVTAYCPRCGTALSDAEVALGYETAEDPSVYVRFAIVDAADPDLVGASLLVWTTTPWTLPSNTGIAVDATATYVVAERRRRSRDRRGTPRGSGARRGMDDPEHRSRPGVGRRPVPASLSERRGRPHGRLRFVRSDERRHRHRAPGAGVRPRGPRGRTHRGLAGVQAGRRRRSVHGSRPRVHPGTVRQGRRSPDHRGSRRAAAGCSAQARSRTPIRSAGAAARRSSITRERRGTSERPP